MNPAERESKSQDLKTKKKPLREKQKNEHRERVREEGKEPTTKEEDQTTNLQITHTHTRGGNPGGKVAWRGGQEVNFTLTGKQEARHTHTHTEGRSVELPELKLSHLNWVKWGTQDESPQLF